MYIIRGPTSLFADGDPIVPTLYFERAIIFLLNGLDTEGFVLKESPGSILMGTHTEKASGQAYQQLY